MCSNSSEWKKKEKRCVNLDSFENRSLTKKKTYAKFSLKIQGLESLSQTLQFSGAKTLLDFDLNICMVNNHNLFFMWQRNHNPWLRNNKLKYTLFFEPMTYKPHV